MEFLAVLLEPYKDIISTSAATVTHLHQVSGAVICNTIRKQKSTEGISLLPFLIGTVISALVARFGLIMNDTTALKVHLFGFALNIGYVSFYLWYTNNAKDKTAAWTKIGYVGAFVGLIYAYTFIENPENLPTRFGLIFTAVIFCLISSPLLRLGKIIRTKDTKSLSKEFPIILTGTLISFLWLLHGIVRRETFSSGLNAFVFLLNAFQLSLLVIYPSKPVESKHSKKEN